MKTLLSQFRDQFENIYNTVCRDLMSNNDDIKNEAYNRLVEAVREWATARRLEIKNNHNQQSPMDIDIVQEQI